MITAQPQIQSTERLTFTLFVAIAIHALLIFGLTFDIDINKKTSSTLEITLATHQSDIAPDNADFIAQNNQQGSGTEDKPQQITTEHISEFESTQINEVQQARSQKPQPNSVDSQVVTTITTSDNQQNKPTDTEQQQVLTETGEDAENRKISQEIASLKAKLDKQREAYAKKPRIRRLTSVAAVASADAAYLHQWSQKVEFVGNRNFPKEALNAGIHGKLRLLAVIDNTGNLVNAEILQSSGFRVLDDAAMQIVHLSSPFPPFPTEIRQDTDQLEIIRTWYFEITGLSTGS